MKRLTAKVRPTSGFSHLVHLVLTLLLPALVFLSVERGLVQLAILLIILAKWRMFAVRPRHWLANLRANGADIMVGVSTVIFMTQSSSWLWQLIWAVAYAAWLVLLKPSSSLFGVSIQALVALVYGLMATFLAWGESSLLVLSIAAWVSCFVAAQHFFSSFDEPHTKFLAHCWALFGLCLTWVLGHWLLFYGFVAQPTLILTILGFGLATLYYLETTERLSTLVKRQFVFVMLAVIVVIIAFSDWGDKTL